MNALADHLWQSTLFAVVAGLLTLALRNNPARVRHWLWLAASCKFLIPLSILIGLGGSIHWRTAQPATQSNISVVMDQVSQPFTAPAVFVPLSTPGRSPLPPVLFGIWACGFFGITCSSWIRLRRVRTAVRAGTPVKMDIPIRAISSPTLLEPGIYGIFRPTLLLPVGIFDRLTPAQLKAVIAHELCHVRRRDNLVATIHMLVETVFWFHPLVWWIGKRMVAEREQACDEEVLRIHGDPRAYAEGILNVCKLYAESPLSCVSGVTGSNLKQRIEAIMINRVVLKLTLGKKAALVVAATAVLALPLIIGMLNAPAASAQSAATQKFEVASIHPCQAPEPGGRGATKGGGSGGGQSPGTLNICRNLAYFINLAYVQFANGDRTPPARIPIEGGPAWVRSDRYQINAKAGGEPRPEMVQGPMLKALLEDRFKLKTHRETREVPVYDLTIARGGPKMQPFKEGSCFSLDPDNPPAQPLPPPEQRRLCGGPLIKASKGQTPVVEFNGAALNTAVTFLGNLLGRPVIDKTGMTGLFDFRLQFVLDESTPGLNLTLAPSDDPPGPSIFTAVQQQLGLKLDSAKGPGEFLVIDSVERPSEN